MSTCGLAGAEYGGYGYGGYDDRDACRWGDIVTRDQFLHREHLLPQVVVREQTSEVVEDRADEILLGTAATELRPELDRAWYGLGLVLIRLQRFDEALVALKKNTQLQPMSPYGWYQLARVHVDRHEPEEALRIIRHLKRFEPKVAAQLERETGIFVPPAS